MKDKFLLGLSAGLGGAVVMGVLDRLVTLFPGVSTKLIYGVSNLFVTDPMVGTFWGSIPSLIGALICGSLGGLAFLAVFEKTGYNYPLVKGALLGLIYWFLTCGILNGLLKLNLQDRFIDNIIIILIHIAYGITTAWLVTRFRLEKRENIS